MGGMRIYKEGFTRNTTDIVLSFHLGIQVTFQIPQLTKVCPSFYWLGVCDGCCIYWHLNCIVDGTCLAFREIQLHLWALTISLLVILKCMLQHTLPEKHPVVLLLPKFDKDLFMLMILWCSEVTNASHHNDSQSIVLI